MTLCIDTQTMIIESIDSSIREVFEMMAGADLLRLGESCPIAVPSAKCQSHAEVSVFVGLAGELQGSLCISLEEQGAIQWTRALIDHQATSIDQTVVDAVGELGNMVVGGAKRRMTGLALTMSLPSVILAGHEKIAFPSRTVPLKLDYGYQATELTILISLQRGSN